MLPLGHLQAGATVSGVSGDYYFEPATPGPTAYYSCVMWLRCVAESQAGSLVNGSLAPLVTAKTLLELGTLAAEK